MGCMLIRKTQGFTELWCDDPSDGLGDWIQEKFGKLDLDHKTLCKEIFFKILNNKALFIRGYNLVKKNFHAEGEPKRDMTLFEYIYHLNFVLGSVIDIDKFPLPGYLHRNLGKSHKENWVKVGFMARDDRSVFSFNSQKEPELKSNTVQKPTKKYNPLNGLIKERTKLC